MSRYIGPDALSSSGCGGSGTARPAAAVAALETTTRELLGFMKSGSRPVRPQSVPGRRMPVSR
jgi:hypothetical protein